MCNSFCIWYNGSSRLCVIIFAYGIVKCLSGKTFRAILRIFYQYRPRFHTETRRAAMQLPHPSRCAGGD
ncbi:Mobile element protein [Microcystis panniformis FACHB-1757]|uniref:Mobile element protein n=1 Tax=Microcystis panniformis FACHB-1757 TaxID=1638788 RepID=A0A0K1RWU1_9CHRO|nr:Mobile element protein [Microcystis panniformis FACHB-1757]